MRVLCDDGNWSDWFGNRRFKTDCTSSVSTVSESDFVKIFPNPTSGKVFLKSDFQISQIIISDTAGRIVGNITGNQSQIDLNEFTSGVYFIQIHAGEHRSIQKIVKF